MKLFLAVCLLVATAKQAAFTQYAYTIEKEDIHYKFISGSTKYDGYIDVHQVIIECTRHIKILNEKGVKQWSTIRLPEPIDPVYRDVVPNAISGDFYLNDYSVEEAEISIRRKGRRLNAKPEPTIRNERILSKSYLETPKNYLYRTARYTDFDLPSVRVGDEIILRYRISMPYKANIRELASFRIFFHGEVPKKDVIIRVSKTDAAKAIFIYKNESEPHSSFTKDMQTDKWTFDELPAALNEVNSRPHLELPHIEVFTHTNNFNNCNQFGDELKNHNNQHLYTICSPREYHFVENRIAVNIGSTYARHKTLKNFVDTLTSDTSELFLERLKRPFNYIATNFKYDPDTFNFLDNSPFEKDFGDDLEAMTIRESNRLETYAAVLDQMHLDYMLITPIDKRVGQLSDQYIRPYYSGDQFFSVISRKGEQINIIPKCSECSFYVEELPFYYEGSVMAISYSTFHTFNPSDVERTFGTRHQGWHLTRPMVITPSSTNQENFRNTRLKGDLDLSTKAISASGSQTLSGQFSTLCRSTYMCNESTLFVNAQYSDKMWDNISTLEDANYSVKTANTSFPFETSIDFTFLCSALEDYNDTAYSIDLSGWINHIDFDFDTTNRALAFYSDFLQSDKYSCLISLSDDVDFIDIPSDISIQNSFGTYQFRIKASDSSIQLFSNLLIKAERIEASDISDVYEIYSAAKKAENLVLRIKTK